LAKNLFFDFGLLYDPFPNILSFNLGISKDNFSVKMILSLVITGLDKFCYSNTHHFVNSMDELKAPLLRRP